MTNDVGFRAAKLIGLAAISALITTLNAASLTWTGDLTFAPSWHNARIPVWSNGWLIEPQYDDTTQPLIWLYGHQETRPIPFSIPGARSMILFAWDRGAQGDIGVAGSFTDGEGRGTSFIAWLSPDESQSAVIRTGTYLTRKLSVAPDGTIWTAGAESLPSQDLGVIRHFDHSGTLLASFIPQSTFANRLIPRSPRNRLEASKDRIAWYSPEAGRYVEVSLAGELIADLSVPAPGILNEGYGFAFTVSNEAYLTAISDDVSNLTPNGRVLGVYMLDKIAHAWKPVVQWPIPPHGQWNANIGHLIGADEDKLVFEGKNKINFYAVSK